MAALGSRWRTRWSLSLLVAIASVVPLVSAGPAQAQGHNYALYADVGLASLVGLPCTLGSGAGNAVDGAASNIYTDKWCVRGPGVLEFRLNLNPEIDNCGIEVDRFVVKHAGAAGEPAIYNTRDFTIKTWNLGGPEAYYHVTNNTAAVTTIPGGGRSWATDWIRLEVTKPTQTGRLTDATRIYEVEVWGSPSSQCGVAWYP